MSDELQFVAGSVEFDKLKFVGQFTRDRLRFVWRAGSSL